jgi:signal transduction histidine kinase
VQAVVTEPVWVILARDGRVAFVSDPVGDGWLGTRLAERADVAEPLRAAAKALEAHRSERLDVEVGARAYRLASADVVALYRRDTDLVPLLRGALEPIVAQAEADEIAVTVDAEHDVPTVRIDAEKIAWAVTNLVGNALRYVPKGTRRLPGGTVGVHVAYDRRRQQVVIAVQDDGPGIPEAKKQALFRRDGQVTHGTGLGLMLIADVVTAHGGTVDVESSTDRRTSGVTVNLRLPVA